VEVWPSTKVWYYQISLNSLITTNIWLYTFFFLHWFLAANMTLHGLKKITGLVTMLFFLVFLREKCISFLEYVDLFLSQINYFSIKISEIVKKFTRLYWLVLQVASRSAAGKAVLHVHVWYLKHLKENNMPKLHLSIIILQKVNIK